MVKRRRFNLKAHPLSKRNLLRTLRLLLWVIWVSLQLKRSPIRNIEFD